MITNIFEEKMACHIKNLNFSEKITSLTCSPDGYFLAIHLDNDNRVILIYDVQHEKILEKIVGSSDRAVAFSPDNKTLAIASNNDEIHFYSLQHKEMKAIRHGEPIRRDKPSPITCLNFEDNYRLAIGYQNGNIFVWEFNENSFIKRSNEKEIYSLHFHPSLGTIATDKNNTIRFWGDTASRAFGCPSKWKVERKTTLSLDGCQLALTIKDNYINVINLITGTRTGYEIPGKIYANFFLPNGRHLALVYQGIDLYLWDLEDQTRIQIMDRPGLSSRQVKGCYVSSQSNRIFIYTSNACNNYVTVWDVTLNRGIYVKSAAKGR